MSYIERFEPLTSSDRKELRKNIIGAAIFSVFAGIIFYVMYYNIGSHGDDVFVYFLGGIGLMFIIIIGYIAGTAALDLRDGQKKVITGNVTDKERYKRRSTGKKSNSTPRYYVFFDDKKVEIQDKHFHKVSVGDEIELHSAKWSKKSLDLIQLNTSESSPSNHDAVAPKSTREQLEAWKAEKESVVKKEYPLTKDDLSILRKKRNGKLFTNFFILIFFSIMTLGFGIGAVLDWVFIIPEIIFLVIIYFSFKWIVRCFSKFSKDKKAGAKIVAVMNVKDKQINSGRGKNYSISTVSGSFPVNENVYNEIKIGDTVYAFYGRHSNWLIGFHTEQTGYVAE